MFLNTIAVALAAAQAAVTPAPPAEEPLATSDSSPPAVGEQEAPHATVAPLEMVIPSPAVPVPLPTGLILWRNVESGMPVAQLRALYPKGKNVAYKEDRTVLFDVPIIEGCEAKVNVMHPTGVVKEIVMRGEGSLAGRCSLKVITALSGKYGQPDEKDQVHGSILAREGKNYVWAREGITLQFKRYTQGALGGGGLFAASWELRYSANAIAIDL